MITWNQVYALEKNICKPNYSSPVNSSWHWYSTNRKVYRK